MFVPVAHTCSTKKASKLSRKRSKDDKIPKFCNIFKTRVIRDVSRPVID